jgi:hypothetical protein
VAPAGDADDGEGGGEQVSLTVSIEGR